MELVLAFVIVAIVGYFIMIRDRTNQKCFAWCDVGKALMLWGITELVIYTVKGPISNVRLADVGRPGGRTYLLGGGGIGIEPEAGEDAIGTMEGGDDEMVYGGDPASAGLMSTVAAEMGYSDPNAISGGGKGSILSHVVRN